MDEFGEPRPAIFTLDLICEPKATGAPLPLEFAMIAGEQHGDTAIRLKTAHACPLQTPPPCSAGQIGGRAAKWTGGSGSAGAVESGSGSGGGGISWLGLIAALLSSFALLAVLFVGFAPMSLRSALAAQLSSLSGGGSDASWEAVQAEMADERQGRRAPPFDMEYRAL